MAHDGAPLMSPAGGGCVLSGGHASDAAAIGRGTHPRAGETRRGADAKGFEVRKTSVCTSRVRGKGTGRAKAHARMKPTCMRKGGEAGEGREGEGGLRRQC